MNKYSRKFASGQLWTVLESKRMNTTFKRCLKINLFKKYLSSRLVLKFTYEKGQGKINIAKKLICHTQQIKCLVCLLKISLIKADAGGKLSFAG